MKHLARSLRMLATLLLLSLGAQAQALDYTLSNANPDTGDGGWLKDHVWASDPVHGGYWQGITIVGTDRSAWMSRDTPWGYPLANTTTLSTSFAEAASISFDWSYISYDTDLSADAAGYILNGISYTLSLADSASASGRVTLTLNAGDTLGWFVSSTDMLGGRANLSLSNVQIGVVPEAAPASMALAGLLMVGFIARRRLRARR